MNFKRVARDRKGDLITKGSIIQYPEDNEPVLAVILEIERFGRDTFPDLHVMTIKTKDMLGKEIETKKETLNQETYRRSRLIDPSQLRDDVSRNIKAMMIREDVIVKMLRKR